MRPIPALALAAILGVILAVTLQAAPQQAGFTPFSCIFCGERATADAIANVILFVPLGAALAAAFPLHRLAWRWGPVLSLVIELAQRFIAGRDASVGDVITNTTGTLLGWVVWRYVASGAHRPAPAAWPAAVLAFAGVVGGSVWLLQPAPTDAAYYGGWTPSLGQLAFYRGRVLNAAIDGTALRPHLQSDPTPVRDFVSGRGTLTVRFIAGPAVPEIAALVSVFDAEQREIMLVGPDRAALVLRFRKHASAWRVDEPDVRFENAARWTPGDTVDVAVQRTPRGACLTAAGTTTCLVSATPGRAWSLVLYPESFPAWVRTLLDLLWVAGLAGLLGWCAGTVRTGAAAAAVAVAVLWGLPLLLGAAPAPPGELAAAVAGGPLGGLLRRAARRLGPKPPPTKADPSRLRRSG